MEISIVKIGNSKGLRLSKYLIEKYNISETVEMILEEEQIIIRPVIKPRKGWDEAFKKMNTNGDDRLLIDDVFNDENPEEWK
jgi:antitoxin MazE